MSAATSPTARSNVTYSVDDVVIGTDEKTILGPFVAPGRRKLFIDRWKEAKKLMMKSTGCPPVLSLADFGLSPVSDLESQPIVKEWRSACERMDAREFAALARKHPNAPIFPISELMALTRGDDHDAAIKRWEELDPILHNDVRYGMIAAIADLDHYFVLLWKGEFNRAARFAEKNDWPERAADAFFLSGSPALARPFYEEALRREPGSYWPTVKLSDVFHLLGDARNEKAYRQKIYGRLEE
jgi:hypothetical protein